MDPCMFQIKCLFAICQFLYFWKVVSTWWWTTLAWQARIDHYTHSVSGFTLLLNTIVSVNDWWFGTWNKQRVVRPQQTVSVNVWSRILPQNASQTRCSRLKSTALPCLRPRCHILSFIKTHWNIIMYKFSFHQIVFIVCSPYFWKYPTTRECPWVMW